VVRWGKTENEKIARQMLLCDGRSLTI
jgi:hypothetical protein